ncbi:hypothetical protein N0V84_006988 [Fusarium piperis]|uniref:C2H2 type master regulator of conidiophore development brlA n=1 Tax=Fusarium piperis TaxID=1435070 RepID=A0A9W8WAU9_9HYPO|nr:hypothetical protein N0V84_006988 [Fusarium piperis]
MSYNQISEVSADPYRHPDPNARFHQQWPSSSSSSAYYQDQQPSDPRSYAFSNHYASQSHSGSSQFPYEVQQVEDHQMWQPQEYGGASSSSVATGSPPNASDEAYTWMGAGESSDRNLCQCGKTFRRPSDLAKHQKYHIKFFSCLFSGCDKAFATQKDLTRHMRTHRKGEGYQCKVEGCRKAMSGHVYSRKDNFDRHMRTAHPEHPHI